MATLGTLEYLISVNDSGVSSQINKAENKMKNLGNSISSFTIAKGTLIADFAKKAFSTVYNVAKDTIKGAVDAYGRYEQLEGGIRKLFGQDVKTEVINNARNAFKTAGMSANEYMELVTDFSASLISSLNGDTSKAAEVADMAIQDMADNANTFGTSMDSIQNAYKGFAKQNYTMLDNLKLGYGGTRKEMQRLLKDAEKIQKQQGKNTKYSINNLNDIYEAIHVIQESMNITGTTKNEAEGTIEGSIASAKAAWDNVLTALGSGQNVGKTVKSFAGTLKQVFKNVTPVAIEAVRGLFEGAKTLLPEIGNLTVGVLDQLGRTIFGDETWDITINWIQNAWDAVKTAFDTAIQWVGKTFETTVKWLQDAWDTVSGAFTSVGEWVKNAYEATVKWVRDGWTNITNSFAAAREMAANAIKAFVEWANKKWEDIQSKVDEVKKWASNAFQAVVEWGQKKWEDIQTKVDEASKWATNAFKATVEWGERFYDDIMAQIHGIPRVIDVTVQYNASGVHTDDTGNTFGGGGGNRFGTNNNGSRGGGLDAPITYKPKAKGDWSVPYDNYPALLHRGEIVMNKSQARRYRDGESAGISAVDIGEVVGDAIKEAMGKINVYLSADKVGNLTTQRINKNIQAISNARLRALGG